MVSTLSIASDGYLSFGDHLTLSIASSGYLDVLLDPEIIIKTITSGGNGKTIKQQRSNVNYLKIALSEKQKYLQMLKREDEEIFIIMKVFLHCNHFKN